MRRFWIWGLVIVMVGTGLAAFTVPRFPLLQKVKRAVAPFMAIQSKYDVPNTSIAASLPPLEKAKLPDNRTTLEERIAGLLIAQNPDLAYGHPGGVLISYGETRKGNLFGKYPSYDPVRTRQAVEQALATAAERNRRILLYDEGEGGYVMRMGGLPSAWDVGDFYFNNNIGATIANHVVPSASQSDRKDQITALYTTFAQELNRQGIDVVLAPVLDVAKDQKNMIGQDDRSFSRDPDEVLESAHLYIDVMKRHGLKVVGKHFLTLGTIPSQDAHYYYLVSPDDTVANARAADLYRALKDDLDGIMLGPAGNPEDDLPYVFSEQAVTTLTEDIGYDGLIMTDELLMRSMRAYVARMTLDERRQLLLEKAHSIPARAAILAFDAGAHVLLISEVRADFENVIESVSHAYRIDPTFRQKMDTAFEKFSTFAGDQSTDLSQVSE